MNTMRLLQRVLVPRLAVSAFCYLRYRCSVSPRAEVEVSGNLRIGRGSVVSSYTKIKSSAGPVHIGRDVFIATGCFISAGEAGLSVGDDTLIGPNVMISSINHRYDRVDVPIRLQGHTSKGTTIGRNVWIGAGSCIVDGSYVGDGAIVVPNSTLSGRFAANSIVQGNPAKVLFVRR